MTPADLDALYTQLCQTMTRLGAANTELFLARFAMLAITSIGQADVVARLIAEASEGMTP